MKTLILAFASLLYGMVVAVRNFLFDTNVLTEVSFDIPVICVGNITVGGTGKTPMVEFLVERLLMNHRVGVISRGYRRRTKGYCEVQSDDRYVNVGDEPLQIKRKFPSIVVAVCGDRVYGINRMIQEHPDLEIVIMDDGFQHRYVEPYISIAMIDYTRPVHEDHLLPLGQLRDRQSTLSRARYLMVTKCPEKNFYPSQMRAMTTRYTTKSSQKMFFTRIEYGAVVPVSSGVRRTVSLGSDVIVMSGIGNNAVFADSMAERFRVVDTIEFEDHHVYVTEDLKVMQRLLAEHPMSVIVMTEKDAVKLKNSQKIPNEVMERMFYQTIRMSFVGDNSQEFVEHIEDDLGAFGDDNHIRM